jgi:mRNA interferase MazF
VTDYVPDRADVVWINFSPQAGHEQASRLPGLVLSPRAYNGASGLLLLCPISNQVKGYRFEVRLPPSMNTTGVVISDHLRSVDWTARRASFEETAPKELVEEVVARIAAILGL